MRESLQDGQRIFQRYQPSHPQDDRIAGHLSEAPRSYPVLTAEVVRAFHDLEDRLTFRDQAVVHPPSCQILRREEEAVRSPQAPALQRPDEGSPRPVRMILDDDRAVS